MRGALMVLSPFLSQQCAPARATAVSITLSGFVKLNSFQFVWFWGSVGSL